MAGWLPLFKASAVIGNFLWGNPNASVSNVNTSGGIVTSRDNDVTAKGIPYFIHCSASAITATGTSRPFEDLQYSWNFGDSGSTETFTRPTDGVTVNSNSDQIGPEAAHVYRTVGTFIITLTITRPDNIVTTVTKSVTTVAFTAGTATYWLDKNVVGGAGDGSSAANAFNTVAALNLVTSTVGFSTFNNLVIKIAKGSDFTGDEGLRFNVNGTNKYTGLRIETYGSGAKPIFDAASEKSLNLTYNVSSSCDSPMYDFVISGLSFKNTSATGHSTISCAPTGDGASPPFYRPIENVYFDNCDFRMDCDTHPTYAQIVDISAGSLTEKPLKSWGFWKCTVTNPSTSVHIASGISGSSQEWFFLYGTYIAGNGTNEFDHHIYPDVEFHELYKWNTMGEAGVTSNRGFGFNLNWDTQTLAPGQVHYARWHLVSENVTTGTWNSTDAGSRGGNFLPGDGIIHFTEMVIERNAMFGHYTVGLMQLPCTQEVTIRDNRAWGNATAASFFGPADWAAPITGHSQMEVLAARVYRNRHHVANTATGPAAVRYAVSGFVQPQQLTDNIFADFRTSAAIFQFAFADMTTNGSLIDRNRLYAPNASSGNLVFDADGTPYTWTTYRSGTGFDPNGFNTTPGWSTTVSQWSDLN